jgi:hypothetical protein
MNSRGFEPARMLLPAATTFVKWNPEFNQGSTPSVYAAAATTTGEFRGGAHAQAVMDWSIRKFDDIQDGDTVYFTLWSDATGFCGILGKGNIVGEPFRGENWRDDESQFAWYINIRFERMFRPGEELPPDRIEPLLPGGAWPQAESGQRLSVAVATILDREWSAFVAR